MDCVSHTHKGAREVHGRGGVLHVTLAINAPRGPDYLARGCSGFYLLVRGYFLRVDLDHRSGGIERSLGHTHKGAREVRGRCFTCDLVAC